MNANMNIGERFAYIFFWIINTTIYEMTGFFNSKINGGVV